MAAVFPVTIIQRIRGALHFTRLTTCLPDPHAALFSSKMDEQVFIVNSAGAGVLVDTSELVGLKPGDPVLELITGGRR